MDIKFSNILYDVENLLYEFFLDLALFPKTLLRTFSGAAWIHSYVTKELEKEQKDRFKDYLNPIIFWVVSYIVLLWGISINVTHPLTLQELVAKLLVWALFPIAFTVIMLRLMKMDLNQTDFRRPLYIQMMAFGVVQTAVGLICAPLTLLNQIHSLLTHYPTGTVVDNIEYVIHFALILAFIIPFLWLIAAQLFILNNEFQGHLSKLLVGWIGGLCVFVVLLASISLLDKEATYVIGKIFATPMSMP